MSITSERIREQPFFHVLADDAAEDIEMLEEEVEQLRAENAKLKAELAAAKKDAELWREREAKIKLLKERGFLRSPLRDEPYKVGLKSPSPKLVKP